MFFLIFLTLLVQEPSSSHRELKAHIRFLADDSLEGRETTFRGQKIAARYIATQFQKQGLKTLFPDGENPYYQEFHLYKPMLDPGSTLLTAGASGALALERDFVFYGLQPKEGRYQFEAVFAGFGIRSKNLDHNDYQQLDVEGKWVLLVDGYPPHIDGGFKDSQRRREQLRDRKIKWAERAGAKGLLFINGLDFSLPDRQPKNPTRQTFVRNGLSLESYELRGAATPIINLRPHRARALLGEHFPAAVETFAKIAETKKSHVLPLEGFSVTLEVSIDNQPRPTENVLGMVVGSDPVLKDEAVVISAHYDHLGTSENGIFNGADDNASGTAVVIDMARRFAGAPTKRSLVFLALTGEEKGLLGSAHFLKNCPIPVKQIVANINLDMVGRNDPYEIGIIPAANDDISDLNKWVKEVNASLKKPFTLLESFDKYHRMSDHYSFVQSGIPAMFFFADIHDDYHRESDEWQKIDYHKVERVAELVQRTIETVANRKKRPDFLKPRDVVNP